jgi:hypothetical protein
VRHGNAGADPRHGVIAIACGTPPSLIAFPAVSVAVAIGVTVLLAVGNTTVPRPVGEYIERNVQ